MTDASTGERAPLCLAPRPIARPPRRLLPQGSIDCHFHVFRAGAPVVANASYTPQMVGLTEWLELARSTGIERGVLVQPSVYGTDNSALLSALDVAPDVLRGIAVLPPETPFDELRDLHRRGIRGVRCNTRNPGGISLEAAAKLVGRMADDGWILQLQMKPTEFETLPSLIPALGVPVVIDHFGLLDPRDRGVVLGRLRRLLDAGHCYVKLSAPYRLSGSAAEIRALAAGLATSHPERLLWGSDWPHTELWTTMPDDTDLIDEADGWFGDDATRHRIFVDTPKALFFPS